MTITTENCSYSVDNSLHGFYVCLLQRIQQWFALQRIKAAIRHERQQLLNMPSYLLKDIGVTREQAFEEAGREDVPARRMPRQF